MTAIKYNYFTTDQAIQKHSFIIENSGGKNGIKDVGLVDSVLSHIQNDDYYPELIDKVTHIAFGLNKNHAFTDGNKRASIALSSFFLELNGHDFAVRQYTHGMEEVAIWIAKNLISRETLKKIIEFLIYDEPVHVAFFIAEAKFYRYLIEPHDAPIDKILLTRMVDDWLSGDMELSEETKLILFDAISVTIGLAIERGE